MRKTLLAKTVAAAVLLAGVSTAPAAVLHSFTSADATIPTTDDGYDPAEVSAFAATNVTGPTNGTSLASGVVGLNRFWNSEWAGFSLTSTNGTSIDNATEFATGYLTWTVTADPGYVLNLSSLNFASARGGTSVVRGYEIYAQVNGGAFNFGDTPVKDVDDEVVSATRLTPLATSVDLSGAEFQNLQSVTFRYYPTTAATTNTIDFSGMTLQGSVVPEPSGVAFVLATAGLLSFRRKRS